MDANDQRKRGRSEDEEEEEDDDVVGPLPGDFKEEAPPTKKTKCEQSN